MNKYVIGDIHGQIDQLQDCLKLVNFDFDNDQLITLGDIVDRGPDSYACIELLKTIKNRIDIQGNHDECWLDVIESGGVSHLWDKGGKETLISYTRHGKNIFTHLGFFKNQRKYYIDEDNNLFVHGGFNRHFPIDQQLPQVYTWDRDLWLTALSHRNINYPFKIKDKFKNIFIGHTPTTYWKKTRPMQAGIILNLDTGCGKGGLLTIMNIETKKFKQA